MSQNLFDKFNSMVDGKALAKDVREVAKNGGGDYEEVPHGQYEVSVEKMELKESKNGNPMLSIWFKVLSGKFKNSFIFMNQVLTQGFQIHVANEMMRRLCDDELEIDFDGDFASYNKTIVDVFEITGSLEYVLDYEENKKGYNTFKILEIFDVEE